MNPTQTAKKLDITENKASYDSNAKLLMADPPLLAYILKQTVSELKEFDEREIVRRITEQYIAKIPVDPGYTNASFRSLTTESAIKDEGVVYFDILFTVVHLDDKDIETYLFVDFEIQRDAEGSDIFPRAVFYSGRMLSIQYGHEVNAHNYKGLKKVYSIWACVNCAKMDENTISRYYMAKEDVFGTYHDRRDCNMIEIIMIRLPENVPEKGESHPLIRMVGTLLSDEMPASQKKEILEKEYNIKMTQDGERRLINMCNLSEGILEKGIEKGIALEKESSIRTSVEIFRDMGCDRDSATEQVAKRHNLSLQDARMKVKRFW